jgi:hypothetical protein
VDAENTSITYSGSASTAAITVGGGSVAFTNMQFNGGGTAIQMSHGSVTLDDDTINSNLIAAGGTAVLDNVTLAGTLTVQDVATVTVQSSVVHGVITEPLGQQNGILNVSKTLFDGGSLSLAQVSANVTNNVFVTSTGNRMVSVTNSTGAVEFNTFVNTGATAPQPAIQCSGTIAIDSNIFAWGAASPATGCSPTYSLFDTIATLPGGTGNVSGASSAFFLNLANRDFHLATGSPAVGAADPASTVTTDYDGNPRPNPAGSHADIGAFESAQ